MELIDYMPTSPLGWFCARFSLRRSGSRHVSGVYQLIGVLCASAYFFIFERGGVIYISANAFMVALLLGLFNVGIVVPLFEEMVVRRLLFRGIASYVGPGLSAVMVSVLFGLAHMNIFITATLFSIAMCFPGLQGGIYCQPVHFARML
jgi:membrane protease YdiL (CAAX protease family)